jgi:hypothetical protein
LGLDEEEEGPSYLADLNKAPDFIDEAPMQEVRQLPFCLSSHIHDSGWADTSKGGSCPGERLMTTIAVLHFPLFAAQVMRHVSSSLYYFHMHIYNSVTEKSFRRE